MHVYIELGKPHNMLGRVWEAMGGKHGKYVYVKVNDNEYVKVRVFKNKPEDDPERYIVVGPKRSSAPLTYEVIKLDDLPEEVQVKITGKHATAPEEDVEETG